VARNRKRARSRRSRRPDDASGLAATNGDAATGSDPFEAPSPLEHATPDAELAEAQLALGRPDLADAPSAEELDELEQEDERRSGGAVALPHETAPGAPRERLPTRLVNFLRGSWRELQRVQWPDRRQVMQATGVVLGFVIVAGLFLGVADLVAQKLVNLILK
jgi:preprotein translocase subunit SecE